MQTGDMRTEALSSSAQVSAKAVIEFLSRMYSDSLDFAKPMNQRGFSEFCQRIRRDQRRDPHHVWEEQEVSEKVATFMQYMCSIFLEKQVPREFLESFLYGKPVFNYQINGITLNLVSYTAEDFAIWSFLSRDADKRTVLVELRELAHKIERIEGKKCSRLVLYHDNPARREIISLEQVEALSVEQFRRENRPENSTKVQAPVEPAAVIIMDVEGQFKEYVTALVGLIKHLQRELNFADQVHTSFLEVPGNACLSFAELSPEDLTYFTPDLTVKSQDSFRTALDHALASNPLGFRELMLAIENEIEHGVKNPQIKQALSRTTSSLRRVHKNLFDKEFTNPLRAEDLLKPGKVTVVDISALEESEQRYVVIYLLAILHKNKMMNKEQVRTVLVLDEAHKMFPRNPPAQYKDFYQRIYSFVNDIVHKGRKRRYSVIIATQQPKDVADVILNLPDTKVIFEVEGEQRWMAAMLNGKTPPRGVGTAYVILKGPVVEPLLLRTPDALGLLRKSNYLVTTVDETNGGQHNYQSCRVGYIIQREKTPLRYKTNEGQICANIPFKNAHLILPPQILVAKGDVNGSGHSTTLFCEVTEIPKAFEIRRVTTSKTDEGLKDITSEDYETTIVLTPKREISTDNYDGPFRNQNYSNLPVYLPTEEEVRRCFGLPEIGFPLGEFIVSPPTRQKITYFLPYNPSNYRPEHSEWQIDHSVLVVGSQGRGKTNLLLYLSCLLATVAPEEIGTRIIRVTAS